MAPQGILHLSEGNWVTQLSMRHPTRGMATNGFAQTHPNEQSQGVPKQTSWGEQLKMSRDKEPKTQSQRSTVATLKTRTTSNGPVHSMWASDCSQTGNTNRISKHPLLKTLLLGTLPGNLLPKYGAFIGVFCSLESMSSNRSGSQAAHPINRRQYKRMGVQYLKSDGLWLQTSGLLQGR